MLKPENIYQLKTEEICICKKCRERENEKTL
jgi:hypothetical protein